MLSFQIHCVCCEYFQSGVYIGRGKNSEMASVPISRSYVKKLSNTEKSSPKNAFFLKQQCPQGEEDRNQSVSNTGKNGLSLTDYRVSVVEEVSALRVDVGRKDKNVDKVG